MPANALSFDVEDWYHSLDPEPSHWDGYESRVVASTRRLLTALANANTHATFFVLGHVASRHPELVEEIHAAGHEVASHGSEHRFIYRQTPDEFERDVASSIDLLRSITNEPILGYRAPYFSITKRSLWALDILQRLGIAYDSSIFPTRNHRYGMPGAPRTPHTTDAGVYEIPLTTYPIGKFNLPCAGGIYFRALPYTLTRACFRRLQRRGEPVVFYLHPWECDPGHPVLPVTPTLRIRHYWRLDRTLDRLETLLRDFQFVPFRELL